MTTPEDDKLPDDAKPEDAAATSGEVATTDWQGRPLPTDDASGRESRISGRPTSTGESASLEDGLLTESQTNGESLAKAPAEDEDEIEEVDAPVQLGGQRFVYAAYFAGAIAVAFLLSKATSYAWMRLSLWKPQIGEPHDEMVMPIAALVGAAVAYYYYRDDKTRTMAEEVASELGKVTWPNRDEVQTSTVVVVITTLIATTFFALMDRFWGFVTNLVYGA